MDMTDRWADKQKKKKIGGGGGICHHPGAAPVLNNYFCKA